MKKKTLLTTYLFIGIAFIGLGQNTPPSAAPEISSFNLSPDNIGSAQNSVNLFTGDLNLPITLVSIPGKEGLGVNVSITYNSNVQNQVDTWNLDAPTGILGLGWNMDVPKIVCDHKGTGTREDDTYYIIEGGSSNNLIRTGSGSDAIGSFNTYQTKKYQFRQIKFYYDQIDYAPSGGGPNKWVIVRENGFKYVYGDKNSGRNTIQYSVRWNNWIGNSFNTTGQTQMASTWNLSEINNLWGEKVTFEYTNIDQSVGYLGQKQTEASYLRQIVDPIGRKVQFFYKNKDSQFYMEPHTEQAEPDAYQEVYEKQYLDHIDVLQETGNKYLSVYLRYTSINDPSTNNTAKMLLSYIEKRNGAGQALPGIRFDYFTSTGTTGYKGFLQKITYPTGGTVSYTYTMTSNTIGHSGRNLIIPAPPADGSAPNGYSFPKMWFGSDYVVVTWMALPASFDFTKPNNPATVKLYVYEWVGEWKGKYLTTINNVKADYENNANGNQTQSVRYVDFQVVLEDKFFAILSNPSGTSYDFNLFFKDETLRGKWSQNPFQNINFGTASPNLPTLASGDNFVVIGSYINNTSYPSHVYTFLDNYFYETTIDRGNSCSFLCLMKNYFTAANNYFINFYDGTDTNSVNFYYLSEEKKWIKSTASPISYSGYASSSSYWPSYWYGSNSFAAVMAGNNSEYLYRWDLTYSTFYRDNGSGSLFGAWDDRSYVFSVDNSLVGLADYHVNARAARFDGNNWILSPPNYVTTNPGYVGFGNDFMPVSNASDQTMYIFNPNTSTWSPSGPATGIGYLKNVTNNFFSEFGSGGKSYYRMPNGSWNQLVFSLGDGNDYVGENFIITGTRVYFFKNGGVSTSVDYIPNCQGDNPTCYSYYDFDQYGNWIFDKLIGTNMIGTFNGIPYRLSNQLSLYYSVGEKITGTQVDYPVNSITISGANSTNQNVAFSYNFNTATIDPSGTIAEYAEVSVFPGTTTASTSSNPSGYTKTYFNNGLTNSDDSNIPNVAGVILDPHWLGQSYLTNVFNVTGDTVSITTTNYNVTPVGINNSSNVQVDVGYYVRPSSIDKTIDGVKTRIEYTYQTNSGLVSSEILKRMTKVCDPRTRPQTCKSVVAYYEETDYIHGYEIYNSSSPTLPDLKSINLLTPVIQTSKNVNGVITEAQVTRYKNWSALNLGGTASAPFDQLVWNGTNSSLFSSWDASIALNALTDWTMAQQVSVRDNYCGTPLETLARGNVSSAVILDQYKIRPLAKIVNAKYNQVAYTSFEDNANSNWTPIVVGASGTAKTGIKSFNIDATGITDNQLSSSENYILSYWAMSSGGTLSISGVGAVTINSPSTWTYYENPITGLSSLSIKLGSGSTASVSIDEVRLYPKRAAITTSTYDLVYGPTFQTDNNNQIVNIQYDTWGRPINILDTDGNVIKTNTYNIKK